ncbi:hypothetical protein BLA23254_07950 [Burkholderia lata]|uniref:Uncharacterized protein n=1 Tax=Burkholderia lata (strain ATCC 17760 / DSM 23089 / LMG 22485 / NCIMB 9086 / R18194 / 383) TaxID=482957 RepID=A0A6P2T2J4_BURL3|nr:hypothetical protein [Burkholderia lata]VWC51962.1 hypothetical protein BLA23254_07950 [Burkholderia lata]
MSRAGPGSGASPKAASDLIARFDAIEKNAMSPFFKGVLVL